MNKGHINAGNHDLFRFCITEVKHVMNHITFFALDNTGFLTDIHNRAKLFFRQLLIGILRIDPEQKEKAHGQFVDDEDHRSKDEHEKFNHTCDGQRKTIRINGCHRLRTYFAEYQNEEGKDSGCNSRTCTAEKLCSESCGEGRCRQIDNVVANQNG